MRTNRAVVIARVRSGRFEDQPQGGAPVSSRTKLAWKANGLDLLLTSTREFNKEQFRALVNKFEKTVAGNSEPRLVRRLRTLAADPRLRWTIELYCALLWWAIGEQDQDAAAAAKALWTYLFGRPVPHWCSLDAATNSYELDIQRWKKWYDRLQAK